MPNRLIDETSPYLKQHAHNPVDWYPWGDEAFAKARAEDRPILLSIGYAACHWCHVMERESFEDETTARIMNEWFVSVKVDREERPDVDAIYMQATQAMTGHGGWPMTVFLTPTGEPFYAGTYFPPDDRHGVPSFKRILVSVADAWRTRRANVEQTADALRAMYAESSRAAVASGAVTDETLVRAVRALAAAHDREHGGTRGAPKFPQAMTADFLLRRWARTEDDSLLAMVVQTFRGMARGGIYDQIGGGFHRYAVDDVWLVPHFEIMLSDQAQISSLGVHLWQATKDTEVKRVTTETLAFVAREMTAPDGGFYSSLDADSEGEEGKFYVWDYAELVGVLKGAPHLSEVLEHLGVSPGGNFEGKNILHVAHPIPEIAAIRGVPEAELVDAVQVAKNRLFDHRVRRARPGRDEKILASWNALMLRAIAEAARVWGDAEHRQLAVRNAEFLASTLVDAASGRVMRVHTHGITKIGGFLEDHAAVALAFISVYELTFERRWLDVARRIGDAIVNLFWDSDVKSFFDIARDHERLVARPREPTDNALPSGTSLAAELLLRLATHFDLSEFRQRAGWVLETLAEPMARHAMAFGHLLGAADMSVDGAIELALVGNPAERDFRELLLSASSTYVPALVIAGGIASVSDYDDSLLIQGRKMVAGKATAYVCRRHTCALPTSDAVTLAEQLAHASRQ